jgi:hypothetical protein
MNLIKSGDIDALQRYRASIWTRDEKEIIPHALGLLGLEYDLRHSAQFQAALKNKIAICQRRSEMQPILATFEKERIQYWLKEREWYARRAFLPDSPFRRGMDLWRSKSTWYMHPLLVQDCAERGGCCGRQCGCCLARHDPSMRKLTAGHCTTACLCCEQTRGIELTFAQRQEVKELFNLSIDTYYSYRIVLASFQGLTKDSLNFSLNLVRECSDTETEVTGSWDECRTGD